MGTSKIAKEVTVHGKKVRRIVGVNTMIEVFKSSVWKPHSIAPLTILFDYGIDDIRQNLQYVKDFTKNTVYMVEDNKLGQSMDSAIIAVEEYSLEKKLRKQVTSIWEDIESKFDSNRKVKRR